MFCSALGTMLKEILGGCQIGPSLGTFGVYSDTQLPADMWHPMFLPVENK